MVNRINWSELERRGLITPSPGREEAVRDALAKTAAKKAAQCATVQSQAKRK